jgi:thiol-disulfide isomerase/thioredoxin
MESRNNRWSGVSRKLAGPTLLLFSFFFTSDTAAQTLQGTIFGHLRQMVYLWRFNTAKYEYIRYDSLRTDVVGGFTTQQPKEPGLYGLSFSAEASGPAMYVWMGEGSDIRFSATRENPTSTVRWEDKTNSSALSVSQEIAPLTMKFSICSQLLDMYPDSSGRFYRQVQEEYLAVQKEMEQYRQATAAKYRGMATEQIVRQYYFSLPGKRYREAARTAWQKEHFLDSVNFADPVLQRSHLLRDKINQYLGLYGFPERFDNAEAAAAAIRPGIKILMQHCLNSVFTRHDPALQLSAASYVSGYLFQRFSYMGMDDMIDEVAAQVPDELLQQNTCTDESDVSGEGVSRIITYKKLFPGKPAPSFRFETKAGPRALEDIRSQHTVLVFWASWCTHCEESLPKLAELYRNTTRDQLEVITISVDTSAAACKAKLAEKQYSWPAICSGKGWNDDVSRSYGVTGTPTFFLLDAQKKIAGKPPGIEALKRMMEQ